MQLLSHNNHQAKSLASGTDDDDAAFTVRDDETEDGAPVLDEEDMEENNLTDEDLENIEWEEPKAAGSGSSEEKDITD